MRNVSDIDKDRSMKLLEETAKEVRKPSITDQKVVRLEQEVQMLRYALSNVFKVLNDLPAIKAQLEQIDYRTLGLLKAVTVTAGSDFPSLVEEKAKEAREEAFNELSAKDDSERNLINADAEPLAETSHMIFTTECQNAPDQAIFRSKMDLSCEEFKDYKELFIGKQIGDKVDMKIRGNDHVATILSARKADASKQQQDTP